MSLQPVVDVGENRRNLSSMYAPIAAELAEAERIFQRSWEAGSRSCNNWSITVRTIEAKGYDRHLCCSRDKACGLISEAHPVLAAVVEMIHTATLVHDDILDEAMIRRHAATVNAEWGNETAVLLGRLSLHTCLPPRGVSGFDAGLPLDRPRDQQGVRGRNAANPPSRQPRSR